MTKNNLLLLSMVLISSNLYASKDDPVVCLSNDTTPKHCKAGDILVVRPKEVATSCDFTQQIVRLKPAKNKVEFLCRYTGKVLKIKPNINRPAKPMSAPPQMPPIQRSRRKSSFGSMPFFD
ncbi:MAG: hypothetical protein HQL46_03870 [Gammaproteobacteria bacterium]|nr:hypothetical protein [Gammaproteobacteria bacterium]